MASTSGTGTGCDVVEDGDQVCVAEAPGDRGKAECLVDVLGADDVERIVPPGGLLFSATHHDFAASRTHHDALKNRALNKRIEDFVAWANREAQAQGLDDQAIPADPHGAVGMGRFRRILSA